MRRKKRETGGAAGGGGTRGLVGSRVRVQGGRLRRLGRRAKLFRSRRHDLHAVDLESELPKAI